MSNIALVSKIKSLFSELGIETPMSRDIEYNENTRAALEKLYAQVHDVIGLDLRDDSLSETPKRIAKLMVNESMAGLDYNNFPKCTVVENKFFNGAVTVNDITVSSM